VKAGCFEGPGIWNSAISRSLSRRPIRLTALSVNHRLPNGPTVIPTGFWRVLLRESGNSVSSYGGSTTTLPAVIGFAPSDRNRTPM
jgi:hypothetical protein